MDLAADVLLPGPVSQSPKVGQPGGIAFPEPIEDFAALHQSSSGWKYHFIIRKPGWISSGSFGLSSRRVPRVTPKAVCHPPKRGESYVHCLAGRLARRAGTTNNPAGKPAR